jgi:hypothetical protein
MGLTCDQLSGPSPGKSHYCLVSLMWMKIGSNDITAQVPGVSFTRLKILSFIKPREKNVQTV